MKRHSGKIIFGLVFLFLGLVVFSLQSNAQTAENPPQGQQEVPPEVSPETTPGLYPHPGIESLEYDPATGQYYNAATGKYYYRDLATEKYYEIDPSTGQYYDPETGQYYIPGEDRGYPGKEAPSEEQTQEETSVPEIKGGGELVIEEEITEGAEETITLDLRGIDVTEFLKVLSKKLDINIIPSKSVSGRINLFLNNITYRDALDVIMLSQGLAYEKKGDDIIIVMTAAEYEALYGEKFNEKKKIKTLKLENAQPKLVFNALTNLKSSVGNVIVDEVTGTIILIDTPEKLKVMEEAFLNLDQAVTTEIFELQYAKVADIKENVTSLVTTGAGSVLADERTNTLVVSDLPGNMQKIKQAIMMLDQETKEVLIEAEILEIALRDRYQGGVNWNQIMSNNFYDWVLTGTFSSGLGATLMGAFTTDRGLGTYMDFLNTIGDTKTLSSPRIAVNNNEEASIMVGTREAYVTGTTSQSGESTITSDTVEFVDVGTKLTVVPTINRDGFITMKIKPEVSSVLRTLTTGTAAEPRSQIPIVSTSEAETTVKVKDGTTIMIAGLRRNQDEKDIDGLPFLSRIPGLNVFFSRTDLDQTQTDIIIFLTPYIIGGEYMRDWDREALKDMPSHRWPEKKDYDEQMFKKKNLKEKVLKTKNLSGKI